MNNYYIGIIDENPDEILDIERTILINRPEKIREDQIFFIDYPLPGDAKALSDETTKAAVKNIIERTLHALIVDYKIIVESTCIEGTEIFERISSLLPKFPIMILTNVPDDCYAKAYVDADKVYAKHDFFKVDEDYSKEKTLNIFRNIEKYKYQCARLSASLEEQLSVLDNRGYVPETYQKIIMLEKELGEYLPQEQTTIEKELKLSELTEAVELLREANQLLEGNDKNED